MSKLLASLLLLVAALALSSSSVALAQAQTPLNDTAGPSVAWPLEVVEEVLTPCVTVPQVRSNQQEKWRQPLSPLHQACMPPDLAPMRAISPSARNTRQSVAAISALGGRAHAGTQTEPSLRRRTRPLARVCLSPAAPLSG